MVRLLVLLSLGYLAYRVCIAGRRAPTSRTDERHQAREQHSAAFAGRKAVEADFEEIAEPARQGDGRP